MVIDWLIIFTKWHFAALFTFKNWLKEVDKNGQRKRHQLTYVCGRALLIIWGIIFALNDWALNWVLTLRFEEPEDELELVTDRLKRYKKLLPKGKSINELSEEDKERYLWAVEMCDFLNEYDKGHC